MEKFVKPEMKIVEYEPKDIIAASTSGGLCSSGDTIPICTEDGGCDNLIIW